MLADLGLYPDLYTRFKDDTTILSDELPPGSMLHNGKLIVNHEKKMKDLDRDPDLITMEIF